MSEKRIIISDIHMNLDIYDGTESGSVSWLTRRRADQLGRFLSRLSKDKDVVELVINGDLFDEWIVPHEDSPLPAGSSNDERVIEHLRKVTKAAVNQGIMTGLSEIQEKSDITLTYVSGNHDSLVTNQTQLKAVLPKALHKGTVYKVGNTRIEHGSEYTVFNSNDYISHTGSSLPIGFFFARADAQARREGTHPSVLDFIEYLKSLITNPNNIGQLLADLLRNGIGAIYEAYCRVAGIDKNKRILMDGMDHYDNDIGVDMISEQFRKVLTTWSEHHSVPLETALKGDLGLLMDAAIWLKKTGNVPEKIIVMGHTHNPAVYRYPPFTDPVEFIYGNSGTWIDKHDPTFIEIEDGRTVTLYRHHDDGTCSKKASETLPQ